MAEDNVTKAFRLFCMRCLQMSPPSANVETNISIYYIINLKDIQQLSLLNVVGLHDWYRRVCMHLCASLFMLCE
jgi:hypothetical protein